MSIKSEISNYYEDLVTEELKKLGREQNDISIDIACVALNRLPSRYYRHSVDMAFYLSTQEQAEMETAVAAAVEFAIDYVEHRIEQRSEQ